MDWNKLQNDINQFVSKHGILTNEFNTVYVGGKVTIYELSENSKIFYEIRHDMPVSKYGSKINLYTKATGNLSIRVKSRFFGNPVVKSNIELPTTVQMLLTELAKKIGSFKWAVVQHHLGWPYELKNATVLNFECGQIDKASDLLESIRQIHLTLLEKYCMS